MTDVETQTVEAVERLLHKGKIVEAGDDVEVAVHDAERLIANGAAKAKGRVHAALKNLKSSDE